MYSATGASGKFLLDVPPDGEWAHDDLHARVHGEDPVYVVRGEYAGEGGDGEPILQHASVVGTVDRRHLKVR